MGLRHPEDIDEWQSWQNRRQTVLRRVRRTIKSGAPAGSEACVVVKGGADPRVAVVLDSLSPTSLMSLVAPLRHLDLASVVIIAPADPTMHLPEHEWKQVTCSTQEAVAGALGSVSLVAALGHYLPRARHTHTQLAGRADVKFVTAQHGILTPFSPPLARGTHLVGWSESDIAYWASGRTDISAEVVGSELLWAATNKPVDQEGPTEQSPVFLGQLHGAELDFGEAYRSVREFCLTHGATYRPHPAETDRRSLKAHRKWALQGIKIDRSGRSIGDLRSPLVSAFSTGILEGAARGLPSWVYHQAPPDWLQEVWDRYSMSPWGGSVPTVVPAPSAIAPSLATAQAWRRLAS